MLHGGWPGCLRKRAARTHPDPDRPNRYGGHAPRTRCARADAHACRHGAASIHAGAASIAIARSGVSAGALGSDRSAADRYATAAAGHWIAHGTDRCQPAPGHRGPRADAACHERSLDGAR